MAGVFWHLKNGDLFERLSVADIQRLEQTSKFRQYKRGEPVYLPADLADGVLVLISGRIKLCQLTADGKQSIMTFVEPGELFGEFALVGNRSRDEYAEAVLPSQIVLIPKLEMDALMARYPDITIGITKIMGFRRQRIERRLRNLLFQSNRKRLIHLMLELIERYGERTPEGIRLGIKLTHLEMANVIGSTRETVTVVLGQLQTEKRIQVIRRQITILDLPALAAEVDEPEPRVQVVPSTPSAAEYPALSAK
jgi:CRP-like cAMP-binding protein